MSSLARYFVEYGVDVAGYDRTPSPVTANLQNIGIPVIFEDNPAKLPGNIGLVIYTPAVKDELDIVKNLKQRNLTFAKRAEVLGWISEKIPTIAVAGTHGKTTVSSMIVHILKTAGINIKGFIGGITKNYSSNYIGDKNPKWMVAEADEFDRSFLNLKTHLGIVTSMDADHLDVYENHEALEKSYFQFIEKIDKKGHLVINKSLKYPVKPNIPVTTYGIDSQADIFAKNIQHSELTSYFKVDGIINTGKITLRMPGKHNIENSLAAIAAAHFTGIDKGTIRKAFETYEGIHRRFDIRFQGKKVCYIDDYAHHPEEIKALVSSVRTLLPGRKITGVFQPHLYSRTKDFSDKFAESLRLLDELLLLDIYPAREKPLAGISSELLLEKINLKKKYLLKKEQVSGFLKKNDFEVLLTIGAGDIDRLVEPLTKMIIQKNQKHHDDKKSI